MLSFLKQKMALVVVAFALTSLVFSFQNCSGQQFSSETANFSSAALDSKSDLVGGTESSAQSKLNLLCKNNSIAGSALGKNVTITSGQQLYCEMSFSMGIVGHSLNVDSGNYDRKEPYNVSELKALGWTEGMTSRNEYGLIYQRTVNVTATTRYQLLMMNRLNGNTLASENVNAIYLPAQGSPGTGTIPPVNPPVNPNPPTQPGSKAGMACSPPSSVYDSLAQTQLSTFGIVGMTDATGACTVFSCDEKNGYWHPYRSVNNQLIQCYKYYASWTGSWGGANGFKKCNSDPFFFAVSNDINAPQASSSLGLYDGSGTYPLKFSGPKTLVADASRPVTCVADYFFSKAVPKPPGAPDWFPTATEYDPGICTKIHASRCQLANSNQGQYWWMSCKCDSM